MGGYTGEGEIGLDPSLVTSGGNVVIIVQTLPPPSPYLYEKGVSLLISNVQRNAIQALDPNVKSGNYLNNMMAVKEAKEGDFTMPSCSTVRVILQRAALSIFGRLREDCVHSPYVQRYSQGNYKGKAHGFGGREFFDFEGGAPVAGAGAWGG